MRLIDKLLAFDENSASVSVAINEHCEFFQTEQQGVPSYVGIEYMAQCIAANAGANEVASGNSIKLGFLLGTRKYQPSVSYFKCGEVLTITATRLMQDASGLSVFDCLIIENSEPNTVLAQAKVNVYQPVDAHAYLQETALRNNHE